jgi:flavodoxin
MAVDPQGENSKNYEVEALIAAGGNSSAARRARVKSQLRDRFGRWVEMGRDCKIKIKFNGKVIDVIGKFVGGSPDKPGYGMFVVKGDPNGIPDGVYHFKGKALNELLASLDPDYLKQKGIKLNHDVNDNLIGDVLDKDIEDINDIQRDEIGPLDEALAGGEVKSEEDAVKVVARLKAPKHESDNVVANLEKASKDDVAEGADVVKEALGGDKFDAADTKPFSDSAPANYEVVGNEYGFLIRPKDRRDKANKPFVDVSKKPDGSGYTVTLWGSGREQYDNKRPIEKIDYATKQEALDGASQAFERAKARKNFGEVQQPAVKAELPSRNDEDIPSSDVELGLKALADTERVKQIVGAENLDREIARVSGIQDPYQKRVAYRKLFDDIYGQCLSRDGMASGYGEDWEDSKSYKELDKISDLVPRNDFEKKWDELWKNQDAREAIGTKEWANKVSEIKKAGSQAEADEQLARLQEEANSYAKPETSESNLESTTKKILDATGVDLSQPSDDETNAQARDSLLHMSDLIEKVGDTEDTKKSELYDRLADSLISHFDNKKNGVAGGRSKFAGKADTIQKITERKEGTTIDPFNLAQNRKGIAVALDGRNEETIDTMFFDDKLGDLLLADYIDKNMDKFDGNFKLGTWHDKDNNEVTLDVIELFPEANRDEAITAGQERNQQGIFKLSNKEYIDTGGTGDRGRARREREQSRGESSLRPSSEQGRVESPQSSREGGESSIPEAATDGRTPELRAVPARGVRKFDTGEDRYDSYELTGDRVSDTLNMIEMSQADLLSGLRNPDSVKNFETKIDSIKERLRSGDRKTQDEAINDLRDVARDVLQELYGQPGGLGGSVGWQPDYSTGTELARSLYWYARNVSNEAYPSEVYHGINAFMPDLNNITNRIRPSKESREIESILGELKEAHGRNSPAGYQKDDVLSALGKLKQKLSEMYYESFHNNDPDFDDEEWGDLKPIRDRVSNFLEGAVKGWKPEDYVTTTVPQAANKEVFNSKLVDEVIPELESNIEQDSKSSDWLQRVRDTLEAGSGVAEALVDGIDILKSDDKEGKNGKLVESIQKLINSTKKFKKAYRPSNSPNNSRTPELDFPENPGSDENSNKEPLDPADSVVDGTSTPEETTESLFSKLGIERAFALKLDTRSIDRSKLSERQKKILKTMVTQRNKAIKSLTAQAEIGSIAGYDRDYHYALATTNAIKRLVGGAEQYGENYDFGSGEEDRVKNFVIIEDSIKYGPEDSQGRKQVREMKGYYTSKSGKTFIAEWTGSSSNMYTIAANGTKGRQAGYVNVGWHGESTRGPEFENSPTPSYLKTNRAYRADGIGAANITFARLAILKSGRHFSHSGALTADGANNSKGIDRHDPERHHLSQSEKVLHMMGAPAMELLDRIGWFADDYKMQESPNAYDFKNFKKFKTPIQGKGAVDAGGSFTGPLYLHDNLLISYMGADARRKKARGEDIVAGVDYPEFMRQHVESENGHYGSFSLRTLMTEMSYKDGISKEDGIKRLKEMKQQIADWNAQLPVPADTNDYSYQRRLGAATLLDKSLGEIISGLEQWEDFDANRIDRPKPFPVDGFKMVKGKPYGDVKDDPMSEVFDYGIGQPFAYKYFSKGDNANAYEEWKGNAPPENWTNDGHTLSIRHTTDELKDAIRGAVLKDGIDPEKDWGVMLDHSREYAEAPEMAEVQLSSALRALWLQGVDSDEFIASVIDEKNGNDDISNRLKEQRLPRASLLKEVDNALKNMGVKNVKFRERMQVLAKVKTGSYDAENKIVATNKAPRTNDWSLANEMTRDSREGLGSLIDNDKFDYSDGREDVLGAPSTLGTWKETDRDRMNNGEMPQYTTTNPVYIANNFNKDDLVKAFEDALAEERNGINLKFANGEATEVSLASIRDALQLQGVDTNGLARKTFSERVGRAEMDEKLKAQGLIVPRTAAEVVQHANNVIDVSNFVRINAWLGGINSPQLFQDPVTGKKYLVKALDSGDSEWDNRAVDQEIATQAFFRALGVNASMPQRGTYKGNDNIVVSEWIEAHPTISYADVIDHWAQMNDPDGKYAAAVRNGLMGDLFLDQIDGVFNTGNAIIDEDAHLVRIDGGGGLLWDPVPGEGPKSNTGRYGAGGYTAMTTREQQEAWRDARRDGSFIENGIEFSLDYFLNPDGWHWSMGNEARRNILQGATDEEFKAQAERMFLQNMTPDKIDAVSRIIRDPMDRAVVAETLNKRRSRILSHFGIEDTYRDDEAKLLTRVPYEHQLNEFLTNLGELNAHLTPDEKIEWGKKVMAPDMTAGKLSGLIKELQDLKQQKDIELANAQQLIEEQKKAMEDGLKDATPDTSAFPTSGSTPSAIGTDVINPISKSSNSLEYGDYVLDNEGNPIGRVLFKNVNADGENYVGLVDDDGKFVEAKYDFDEPAIVDIGSRQRDRIPESAIPNGDQRATPEGREYINRLRSRSNKVLNDIKQIYPDAKTLPNGDLVIASTTRTEASRLRRTFRFDVVVHRLPNEKFVSYVRRTQIDEDGNQIGEVSVGRISKETHSSVHLNNRIKPLLGGGVYKGILASSPNNWFNNSSDLQREVVHPGTKQPIPVSLAPKNLNQKYIGNTGIETTNDPIKDALISHVADLIDRGHSAAVVMRRLNSQTVLSKQQVADVADRIQANRQFPGVNQVPYVSRDDMNLVREGDRVRHYHPDGTVREGYVIKRQPLIVSKKPQGDYGYTDVLRVRFDDGTRSPIVAKNLEILRRADGSSPEVRPLVEAENARNNIQPYAEPVGLPSNFAVRDTDTLRTIKHNKTPKLHSQGKIHKIVENGRDVYVPMIWARGDDPNVRLPLDSKRMTDKNVAQEWLISKMALIEQGYAMEDAAKNSSPNSPQNSRRSEEDIPDAANDPESGITEPTLSSFIRPMENAKFDVTDGEDDSTEINMTNVENITDDELPISKIIWAYKKDKRTGKTTDIRSHQEIVTYLNKADAKALKGGIAVKVNPKKSMEQNIEIARQAMRNAVQYKLTGPHDVLGQDLPYGDFAGIMASKVGRKWFKMPQFKGDTIITPEREALYEDILSRMIPSNVKPSPSGIKRIFFMGGGPGAGKSSISKPGKDGRMLSRSDDPIDRPVVPIVQEWLEDGTAKPMEGKEPQGVMINPDDLKMQLPEAQAAHLRLVMQDEEGAGAVRLAAGDGNWAGEVHEESSLLAKILMNRAIEGGFDIVVDGTGNDNLDKMIKKVKTAKAANYRAIGTYMNAKPEDAIGGAIARQYTTKRSVAINVQVDTFIDLAKMIIPTGNRGSDGKQPDSILSGVFDEFVLYDRRGYGEAPYIVGHSENGAEFEVNGTEGQLALDAIRTYLPESGASKDSPTSKESIYGRLETAGKKIGSKLVREKKAEALQRRSQTNEARIKKAEEKGDYLEANNVRSRMVINQIAATMGLSPQQILNNSQVAFMLKRGSSATEIINYLRGIGN